MEALYALLGLVAGLLLARPAAREPDAAPARPLPPDPQEDQWRALFSYEGCAEADLLEDDR